jgi:hypothetical protein
MDTNQVKRRDAQPADEELKKHGDQLQKQVDDVSSPQSQPEEVDASAEQEKK